MNQFSSSCHKFIQYQAGSSFSPTQPSGSFSGLRVDLLNNAFRSNKRQKSLFKEIERANGVLVVDYRKEGSSVNIFDQETALRNLIRQATCFEMVDLQEKPLQ